MTKVNRFEDLEVWQEARKVASKRFFFGGSNKKVGYFCNG